MKAMRTVHRGNILKYPLPFITSLIFVNLSPMEVANSIFKPTVGILFAASISPLGLGSLLH